MDYVLSEDQLAGCLLGGALGDAAGFSFEGLAAAPRVVTPGLFQCSDDTQLTVAMCRSIVACGAVDAADIAAQMLRDHQASPFDGLGASTLQALQGLAAGGHWASVGRKGEYGAGNGAAIRVAPLAFFVDPTDYFERNAIRDVAWITHHNDEAYAGALAIVLAVWAAWTGEWTSSGDLPTLVASHLPDSQVRDRLHHFSALPPNTSLATLLESTGTSGFVVESVPAAIIAAQSALACGDDESFETTLATILSAGGDVDSIASMFGQIVGARKGLSHLPMPLVQQVPGWEVLQELAAGLWQVHQNP